MTGNATEKSVSVQTCLSAKKELPTEALHFFTRGKENEMKDRDLLTEALQARKMSWSPYSNYQVGAALLSSDGQVFRGCNIENAAYSPSNCAERTAFFKAVSEGVRDFVAIAIAGGPADGPVTDYAYPCGVCRQVMAEFCDSVTFRIIVGRDENDCKVFTLGELLPWGFGPDSLP